MVRTTHQKRHTDEDVIVGGQAYRLPRKINDNVASCSGEEQGAQTLKRLGIDFSGFGLNIVPAKPESAEEPTPVKPGKQSEKPRAG